MKVEGLVIYGKGPRHLLVSRRAVIVTSKVLYREWPLEPALVETGAVGVNALDQIPGIAQGLTQRIVLCQPKRQIF